MDIQGLMNAEKEERYFVPMSPPDNSGSESGCQFPGESTLPQLSPFSFPPVDRDDSYPLQYHSHRHTRIESPNAQCQIDNSSPTLPLPSSKRGSGEGSGGSKNFPKRRRAPQACESCRAKKSKCDNERPSCGSCVHHGFECMYKETPLIPVYDHFMRITINDTDWTPRP